jgi:hypothetical protein
VVAVLDLATWYHDDAPASVAAARHRGARWPAGRAVSALYELTKFVELIDLVGPAYAYNFLPVVYGWARKLVADCTRR